MTTATRPLPAHGTYARANGCPGYRPPCKCTPCVTKHRAERKRLKVNRQLGRSSLIDVTPARERLTQLHQDMSWSALAKATRSDSSNLMAIYRGDRKEITRTTHNKIMSVPLPSTKIGTYCIDATGTRRRIQALQVTGRALATIAEAAQTTTWRLHLIADGHQSTVSPAIAERVAAAYRQLTCRPVEFNRFTNRTRNNAAAKGWHGPAAWDDDIDDPTAQPELDEPKATGPIELQPCGTTAAYRRHLRRNEPIDIACRQANSVDAAERKAARKRVAA